MATATEKYNGWTNYETWNVALWIDNEQGSQEYWAEKAQDCWDQADSGDGRDETAVYALSQLLKEEFEVAWDSIAQAQHITASVWADLMGAAISEVNWHEIAEHCIEDCDKTPDEDEDEEEDSDLDD